MLVKELIERLFALPPDLVFAKGFGSPHSWRGSYSEIAFTPEENVTVMSMMKYASSVAGRTFTGWKGDEYQMSLETQVYLDYDGQCYDDGDKMMELFGQVTPKDVVMAGAVDLDTILKRELQDPAFRKKFLRYYCQAAPKPRKQKLGCAYILRDKVCRKKPTSEWRILAMAPQNSGQKAFMLVSLCKGHGERKSRRVK